MDTPTDTATTAEASTRWLRTPQTTDGDPGEWDGDDPGEWDGDDSDEWRSDR